MAALLDMAPNRFTGKIISLWGSRVLCSPTDAKQKRAKGCASLSAGGHTVKCGRFRGRPFYGGSYFWAQRVSLYQTIPVAVQILAFGLQVGGAVLRPLNGLCRVFKLG